MEPFNVISHASYALVTLILIHHYRFDRRLLIFNVSSFICYTLSALHHIFSAKTFFTNLDYFGIYSLIVGSYIAFFKNKLLILTSAVLSAIFLTLQIINNKVYPVGYLLVGWLSILGLLEIPKKHLFFLLAGGILYTLGLLIDLTKSAWSHEIFHVFVMAGTLSHFTFVKRLSEERQIEFYHLTSVCTSDRILEK
jgi:hemolysin III